MDTKMYVTAGLGPSAQNEGFTHDFDLPNETAYAETCASVALIFWAQRMLHLDLDGKYADILELALYNGALSGLSRDGEHYFYANPLESDGTAERWDWHTCPCCTMNVSRLVASVGGYFVSTAPDGVAFHLYGGISTTREIAGTSVATARSLELSVVGRYRDRRSTRQRPATFDVKLRIPGWCKGAKLTVNGAAGRRSTPVNGYLTINRLWDGGDSIAPRPADAGGALYAHPGVIMDAGRVALKRGPLVYCVEEADNPGGKVQRLKLPRGAELKTDDAGRSVRRRRDAERPGHGDRRRRTGTTSTAPPRRASAMRRSRRCPITSGPTAAGLDGGVDPRGITTMLTAARQVARPP